MSVRPLIVKSRWWQYDERTSKDLESSYKNDETTCELLIAGFLYIIDLENMLQISRNDPSRRRRIKRDYATVTKKGIAGLHQNQPNCLLSDTTPVRDVESPEESHINVPETTPISETEDDLESTLQRLNNLRLDNSR